MSSEFLLIGGEKGGKTTFTGGLIYYLEHLSDLSRGDDYDITFRYNDSVIHRDVIDRMWSTSENKYPNKTNDPYLLRIHLYEGSLLPKEFTIDVMDIPGERNLPKSANQSLFDGLKGILPAYTSERGQLIERYVNDLKPKLTDGTTEPTIPEWKQIFQYRYLRSDSAIIMLNLHKLVHLDDVGMPKVVDSSEDILSVASEKRRKLILVTACDVVGYDPEEFDGGHQSFLSGTVRDRELARQIQNSISIGDRKVSRMLNQVMRNESDFSFFGISVPAEKPENSENIKTDDSGNLDLRGFRRVIEWLKQ